MQQLMYIKKGKLEWWDGPEPQLQSPTDAIIRPLAAARCDGDSVFLLQDVTRAMAAGIGLHLVDRIAGDIFGKKPFEGPFPIGHECVGEVVECGSDVTGFERGDVVVIPWSVSCGDCSHCALHLTSKCLDAGDTPQSGYGFGEAMGEWGGLVSNLVRVPHAQHMLVPVPKGVEPASVASASDNLPDAWRTVVPALRKRPGAPVLVVGGAAASIGLYAAGIAVVEGAERVDYLDHDQQRLDIAESLGARPLSMPAQSRNRWYRRNAPHGGGEYPIVVEASSKRAGLRFALRSLSPGGVCTAVGYYLRSATGLPLMQMYANDSTLRVGLSHARANLPELLALVAKKQFRPELVTTLLAPWQDAARAFVQETAKVIVHRPALYGAAV